MGNWLLPAGLALLFSAVVTLWHRRRDRQLLQSLSRMLDAAMDGSFDEKNFNETILSAVELRMARFLSSSTVSARRVAAERDKIKTLLADISHQTKTPVANLLLYAQLLSEQELPPAARTAAEAITSQSAKLSFLIASLVKLSRLETGILAVSLQPWEVGELLEETQLQFLPKAQEKGISLSVQAEEHWAMLDPKWTLEALGNLVDNAIKYTPAGGCVALSVTGYELFVRLDVTDSGMGIPEEEQSKVFGRFYRSETSREEEGVGIGLFLAREIAAAQGGYLKLTSHPGQGSCFSLFLPRSKTRQKGIREHSI